MPEAPGTTITAEPPTADRPLAAVACKRHVTMVEITSTRMLMAHGFLRRVFEVFERHRTAVDVVTTSEVSVSVTVDDAARLDDIVGALREFAEVNVEGGLAILCAVGDNLRCDPRIAARVIGALEGLPGPDGVAGGVAAERHDRVARRGPRERDGAVAWGVLWITASSFQRPR